MVTTYDERCFDLAGIFLGDEPDAATMGAEKFGKLKHELACTIKRQSRTGLRLASGAERRQS